MSVYDDLLAVHEQYEEAHAERPNRCGSEQMARDEAAGDALRLLLDVVEAAAVYRHRQKAIAKGPGASGRGDVERARAMLDEALAAIHPGAGNSQSQADV